MKNSKFGKFIIIMLILCFIILFPFFMEYILTHGPSISRFDNEAWFSFIGSYSGGIITVIVLFATIRYNNRANRLEYEREKIKDNYTKEKADLDNIIDFILLNKISFSTDSMSAHDLKEFIHELHTVMIMIKYTNKDSTDRQSFYEFLKGHCIMYGLQLDVLTAQNKQDFMYIALGLRKTANNIREEVYKRKQEYLNYLENEEKERLKQLFD